MRQPTNLGRVSILAVLLAAIVITAIAASAQVDDACMHVQFGAPINESEEPPPVSWIRTCGGTSAEFGRGVAVAADGSAYLTGYTDSFGAGYADALLVKYSREDVQCPSVTRPADLTFTAGLSGNQISWIISGSTTGMRWYTIHHNGTLVASGTWAPGVAVACNVDGLAIGSHNFTILATDGLDGSVSDTVIVTVVQNGPPIITHPADITYTCDQVGNAISWVITDASTGTRAYTIYRNGTLTASGTWASGIAVSRNVDGLAPGTYNFTITATDGLGTSVQDSVLVTVNMAIPVWIEEDFEDMQPGTSFETNRSGWMAYLPSAGTATAVPSPGSLMGRVEATSTSQYKMTYNFTSAGTYAPGIKIEFDMSTGETNKLRSAYILTSYDYHGGYDAPSDYWFISFNWDGNLIAQHGDLPDVVLRPYAGNAIYHVTLEFIGNMHTLDVSINGTKYTNGGTHFSTRFGRAAYIGAFRADCRTSGAGWIAVDNIDASWINNSANDIPLITHPVDITYTAGENGSVIAWIITDASMGTCAYTIHRNGTLTASGTWTSGIAVSRNVDGLAPGTYNFTITATDGLGGSIQDAVLVVVLNPAPAVTHPADITYTAGQVGNTISWTITDANTDDRNFTVSHNGTAIASGTWMSGVAVTQNVDGLAIGSYNFTIVATDGLGGLMQDSVVVMVNLNTSPTITCSVDYGALVISWTIADFSMGTTSYAVYRDREAMDNETWTNGQAVNASIGGLSTGAHNFTIVVDDGLGGRVQCTALVVIVAGNPGHGDPPRDSPDYVVIIVIVFAAGMVVVTSGWAMKRRAIVMVGQTKPTMLPSAVPSPPSAVPTAPANQDPVDSNPPHEAAAGVAPPPLDAGCEQVLPVTPADPQVHGPCSRCGNQEAPGIGRGRRCSFCGEPS